MALLTPMSLEQARRHGAAYGLDVVAVTALSVGINSNFVFDLAGGQRVFARVCEHMATQAVALQNELVERLASAGVPTPGPLRRHAGRRTVAEHAGRPLVLYPFRPGGAICQAMVDEPRARQVGAALGQIHRAGEGFPHLLAGGFDLPRARQLITSLHQQRLPGDVAEDVCAMADRLDELAPAARAAAEPRAIIHGDLFRDNVLWDDGALSAVLDFEFAAQGCPMFDLMITVLAWCYGRALERSLARALVQGYQAERALADEDLARCYEQARWAALRFGMARVSDYELRPREAIAYKDYRRFLARLRAVEQIGPQRWSEWLVGSAG